MYGMRKRLVSLFHFLVLVFCFVGFTYVWRVKFNDSHCVWCVELINYYCAGVLDRSLMFETNYKNAF